MPPWRSPSTVHDLASYDCRKGNRERFAMLWYEHGKSSASPWAAYVHALPLLHSLSRFATRPLLLATAFAPGQQLSEMRLNSLVTYCHHLSTPTFYCDVLRLPHFAPAAGTEAPAHPLLDRLNLFGLTQCSRVVSVDGDMLAVRPLAPIFSLPLAPHTPYAALCCAEVPSVRWRPHSPTRIVNAGLMVIAPSAAAAAALDAPRREAQREKAGHPGTFFRWLERYAYDQPWLAMAASAEFNVTSLPRIYNLIETGCRGEQPAADETQVLLHTAVMLHYKGSA